MGLLTNLRSVSLSITSRSRPLTAREAEFTSDPLFLQPAPLSRHPLAMKARSGRGSRGRALVLDVMDLDADRNMMNENRSQAYVVPPFGLDLSYRPVVSVVGMNRAVR